MCKCEDFPCCGHDAPHLEHEAAVERQLLEYESMEGGVFEDEDEEYDGQPSELTEWLDFDPDC